MGKSSAEYYIWKAMKQRCEDPTRKDYHNYGGRGITICERWSTSFHNFFVDMGLRPVGTTLDRKDNEKGYSPDNCRWATRSEQNRNSSRARIIEWRGEKKCLTDWAKENGISQERLGQRLKAGWPFDKAIHTRPIERQVKV